MKKICPKCGGKEFIVTVHVTQDWLVDEDSCYMETINDYVETVHEPDDDDVWECKKCGYDAPGKEFNRKEM